VDQNQFFEIKALIAGLDSRLREIELKVNSKSTPVQIPPPFPVPSEKPEARIIPHQTKIQKPVEDSNLLGIVGMACIIIAMILLIKFSIDSGWLTPARQMFIAGLFGSSLVSIPFFLDSKDKSYISLLPAAGGVILHLTIYGATYLHHLLSPSLAIWMVWAVGGLSLWLLTKFEEEVYAILSIAGTYVGTYILQNDGNPLNIALSVFVWDIIFVSFGIMLKNRKLISTAAYFALGIVALLTITQAQMLTETAVNAVMVQFVQILIFTFATAIYSIRNQSILTEEEAWHLFPVYLFFYGLEYSYLHLVNPVWANVFSIGFATLILTIYIMARNRLGKEHLQSSSAVFSLITLMVYHSCYFVMLEDAGKMIAGLVIILMLALFRNSLHSKAIKNTVNISYLLIGYSFLLIVFNSNPALNNLVIGIGFSYAVVFFVSYQIVPKIILIYAAHIMLILSVFNLSPVIGEIWVAPLCVAYAFMNLVLALKKNDKLLATASFPVIFIAIGRFLFSNFNDLSQLERIVSLIVMGGLIYIGGFIFRKIPSSQHPDFEAKPL
jgi:hypothetical protein